MASIELFLELQIRAGHHSLAAEEHEVQSIVARNHGAHLAYSRVLELRRDCRKQCAADAVQTRARLDTLGAEVKIGTPEDLDKMLTRERAQWTALVKAANIQAE